MDVAPPEIEGASNVNKTEKSKEEVYKTVEQATEMDLATPLPIEETEHVKEIKGDRTQQQKEVQAEAVNKKKLSAKQTAALAAARAAKAEKRKALLATTPEGGAAPAPDYFASLRGQMKDMHDMLQDLQKRIPHQSPLQEQQVVDPSPRKQQLVKMPAQSETYQMIQEEDTEYPMTSAEHVEEYEEQGDEPRVVRPSQRTAKRNRTSEDLEWMEEMMRFRKQNRKALNQVFYSNRQMEERAATDPHMGRRTTGESDTSKTLYW